MIVSRKADARLARLQQMDDEEEREGARERHREIRQAEVVRRARPEEAKEEDLSDDELERRREAIRARARQRAGEEEEEEGAIGGEEEEEDEEGSSEYTTESSEEEEEEEEDQFPLVRAVFVPKSQRETLKEREELDAQAEREEEERRRREDERRAETKQLVAEKLKSERLAAAAAAAGVTGGSPVTDAHQIDTDDDRDEEGEFEQWKQREMSRLHRDREERARQEEERRQAEQLRSMTEEERLQQLKDKPREALQKDRGKMKFLQKYYHKGAFYQEDADDKFGTVKADKQLFRRDYTQAVQSENFDKTLLPAVMQVKNFGRRGRTKYTHLLDQARTSGKSRQRQRLLDTDSLLRHLAGYLCGRPEAAARCWPRSGRGVWWRRWPRWLREPRFRASRGRSGPGQPIRGRHTGPARPVPRWGRLPQRHEGGGGRGLHKTQEVQDLVLDSFINFLESKATLKAGLVWLLSG